MREDRMEELNRCNYPGPELKIIEILVKNRHFGQKSKVWSKIESLVKNLNFAENSKFW